MKQIVCVLFAAFLLTTALTAQEVHFGVKAGANFSTLDIKNSPDYDSKTGLHVGGLAHIHISDHFAVQPEIIFSMQGGKDDNGKTKLNYVNVPVLAQFMFGEGFRLQTGPQVGFMVAAERKDGDIEVDVNDFYNTIDVSWTIGAGYLFPSGFGLDARYNHGITDIYESNLYEVRNRVFQVGVFYQFMHNKPATKK